MHFGATNTFLYIMTTNHNSINDISPTNDILVIQAIVIRFWKVPSKASK